MDERLTIAQTLRYAEEFRQLHGAERAQRQLAEDAVARLQAAYAATVRALAAALELRHDETGAHAQRVTALALALTEHVAPELAADPQIEYGFLLHDLGKIGIPDSIVLKPGPLEPGEMEVMRRHVALGEEIVAQIAHLDGVARGIVAAHHERWDGSGYPRGLRGEQIPLAARIFAVVDAYDAMTNDRPYRAALQVERALGEIERASGSQFDPEIARTFVAVAGNLRNAA